MTSIFDGLAGVLNDTFGAPVTVWDSASIARTVQAVFRYEPVEEYGEDNTPSLIDQPVLDVPKHLAGGIEYGTRVQTSDGARFTVVNNQRAQPSPASDAFVRFQLEPESLIS